MQDTRLPLAGERVPRAEYRALVVVEDDAGESIRARFRDIVTWPRLGDSALLLARSIFTSLNDSV